MGMELGRAEPRLLLRERLWIHSLGQHGDPWEGLYRGAYSQLEHDSGGEIRTDMKQGTERTQTTSNKMHLFGCFT